VLRATCGRAAWDHLSIASAEVGLVFCTLVLITGPIWAKPAWGVWWTWEAKLTTTLILWLLLAGILLSRAYASSPEQGARVASVLGVVAALDVPIVYKAVDWWRGQHPIVFGAGKKNPLAPGMLSALLVSMLVFFLLYALSWPPACDSPRSRIVWPRSKMPRGGRNEELRVSLLGLPGRLARAGGLLRHARPEDIFGRPAIGLPRSAAKGRRRQPRYLIASSTDSAWPRAASSSAVALA
jgi:hypothetical protein